MKGERILFFGAHPDDEWGLAPILAEACIEKGATCHFVVASDAKSWGCFLVGGERDLDKCSEIRRGEMKKSAALFGAEAEFYGWEEKFHSHNAAGFERNLREWEEAYGGREGLVQRIAETLVAFHPTQVFALDPRHGSTCTEPPRRRASRRRCRQDPARE